MDIIRIPKGLMPKSVKSPAAFIADKLPELLDYGIATGDIVIIDREAEFVDGELSVFMNNSDKKFRLLDEPESGYRTHFGKVVIVIKYYVDSPFINKEGSV